MWCGVVHVVWCMWCGMVHVLWCDAPQQSLWQPPGQAAALELVLGPAHSGTSCTQRQGYHCQRSLPALGASDLLPTYQYRMTTMVVPCPLAPQDLAEVGPPEVRGAAQM